MSSAPTIPRIVITPGEPAGIGPNIVIDIAQQEWPAELVIVGDPELIRERASLLKKSIVLHEVDLTKPPTATSAGEIKFLPVKLVSACVPGQLDIKNSPYVLRCLEIATDLCLQNKANALVTGPVHKSIMNDANINFSGHTEFLAERTGAKKTIMLFVVDELKVALMTTHIPLALVSSAITKEKIIETVMLLHKELMQKFHISDPKILVCGLNPHAGENGYLGREEIDIITPALFQLRTDNINVIGPLPADTVFTEKLLKLGDVVLAMYHDQALPVVKYIGFSDAVNMTLGLPFVRTSVDHGTAIDLAGGDEADAGSLRSAVLLAIELAGN